MPRENANSHLIQQEVDLQKRIVELLQKELDVLKSIDQKSGKGGGGGGDGGLLAGLLVGLGGGGGKGGGGAAGTPTAPEAVAAGRSMRVAQQKQIRAVEKQAEAATKQASAAEKAVKEARKQATAVPALRRQKVALAGLEAMRDRPSASGNDLGFFYNNDYDRAGPTKERRRSAFRLLKPQSGGEEVNLGGEEVNLGGYKKHKRVRLQNEAWNAQTKFTPVGTATMTQPTEQTAELLKRRKWNLPPGSKGAWRGGLGRMDAFPLSLGDRQSPKEERQRSFRDLKAQNKEKIKANRATFTPTSDEATFTPVRKKLSGGGGGGSGGRGGGGDKDKGGLLDTIGKLAIPALAAKAVLNTFVGTARVGSNESVFNATQQEALGRSGTLQGMAEIDANLIGVNIGTGMERLGNWIVGIMKGGS